MAHPAAIDAIRPVIEAAFGYLKAHPEELGRVLKNAVGFRFGLPIAALRWIAGRAPSGKAPRDLEIAARPPGVHVGASFELMGTPLRATADIFVERIRFGPTELRFEIRLAKVTLTVLDDKVESPLASLLRSGALDLSKPGNLVAYMPKRPALLVDARDDRITIDLLRHPKFANDARLKRVLGAIAPLVTVATIETDRDHLDIALRPFPEGVSQAFDGVRRAL